MKNYHKKLRIIIKLSVIFSSSIKIFASGWIDHLEPKHVAALSLAMKSGLRRSEDDANTFVHSSGVREKFTQKYVAALIHDTQELPRLALKSTGLPEQDIQECLLPIAGQNILTHRVARYRLPRELAADFDNYTERFAQQWLAQYLNVDADDDYELIFKHTLPVAKIIKRERDGYEYITVDKPSRFLDEKFDLILREFAEDQYLFLDPRYLEAQQQVLDTNSNITHISVHQFDLNNLLVSSFLQKNNNRLIVLTIDQAFDMANYNIQNVKRLMVVAGAMQENPSEFLFCCPNAEDITFDMENVKIIHYNTCSDLSNCSCFRLVSGDTIESIGEYFLMNSYALEQLDLTSCKKLKTIDIAFLLSSGIKVLKLPSNVESVQSFFCACCKRLVHLELPEKLVSAWQDGTFLMDCINLETLKMNKILFDRLGGDGYFNTSNFPKLTQITFY